VEIDVKREVIFSVVVGNGKFGAKVGRSQSRAGKLPGK
jgi:hypothetical protein